MKRSRKEMWENVMRRVPKEARAIIDVALESNPALISDMDKIVRTHSCRPERALEFAEHIVALATSEADEANRAYLRQVAFAAGVIDNGEKRLRRTTIADLENYDDGFGVRVSDGWSLYVTPAPDNYEPHVGSEIWTYTIQISVVLGIIIDGHVFRYRTIVQEKAERIAATERRRAKERERFPDHDAAIAKLPEVFQRRIKRFQRAPYFREDLEPYEIFVCEQAALFAERLKMVEKLHKWQKLSPERQAEVIPEMADAGHSNNTFGAACILAQLYLEDPETVLQFPGAMSLLVGSDAYLPLEEREKKSA